VINTTILQPKCVKCHTGSSAASGVDLSTYAGVSTQVTPNDPSTSALYNVVANGIMPPTGALPQADAQLIQSWINSGAMNN
jgi:hypothetical protein